MSTSDLINVILAVLTFAGIVVALVLGIWSIGETRKLQRAQYIERLIDEISQWLLDIDICEASFNVASVSDVESAYKDGKSSKTHFSIQVGNIANELRRLGIVGQHLRIKCGGTTEAVSKAICELVDDLHNRATYHDKYRDRTFELPDDILKVRDLVVEWAKGGDAGVKGYIQVRKKVVDETSSLSRTIWR